MIRNSLFDTRITCVDDGNAGEYEQCTDQGRERDRAMEHYDAEEQHPQRIRGLDHAHDHGVALLDRHHGQQVGEQLCHQRRDEQPSQLGRQQQLGRVVAQARPAQQRVGCQRQGRAPEQYGRYANSF